MNFERLTEQEIKQLVTDRDSCFLNSCTSKDHRDFLRLILAWIDAQAKVEKLEWLMDFQVGEYSFKQKNWTNADWIDAVKARIGWRDE